MGAAGRLFDGLLLPVANALTQLPIPCWPACRSDLQVATSAFTFWPKAVEVPWFVVTGFETALEGADVETWA